MSSSTRPSWAMTRSAAVRSASRKASVPAWMASDTMAPRRTTSSESSLSSSWKALRVSGTGVLRTRQPGGRLEPVSDPPDRGEPAGTGAVGLDLAAKALDVHVERLGVTHVVGAPHLVEERLPGEDPSGVGHERFQQLELLARERHLLSPHRQLVAGHVETDVADLEHLVGGLSPSAVGRPPEHGTHAGHQLPQPVGLGHVVVRPYLEAHA